ncbi:1-phosphofructokinase [Stackebrandtia nassauensis DSM 44728]|uniref:1-phosphofructokinase n=1 Tax=Stackebrandtia nassauensis (strain DSM 44728 / CIP 108903 / NRRL B-16338 / NBRC 102104 / LLR-40K-21) TaxID=446470 RepID=D3Q2S9_STANL|nr:1-phosphofructokinase [Stackebrandtia nassauensis DSM 44728]
MDTPVILTVALNAALDVTYSIDAELRPHATYRVGTVAEMPGGKALNTARILHTLRDPVLATGLLGGHTGERIAERIPAGLRHRFVRVDGESRRALVVADPADATGFWEPGPEITSEEWQRFRDRFDGLLRVARVVVLSGSLPQGLPVDAYAQLVAAARDRGVTTILDCDGEALRAALPQRPDVIKPNAHELAAAVPDADLSTVDGIRKAAETLRAAGARAVIASLGPDGLLAVLPDAAFTAAPPETVSGNPTGAGDACVAGLARGVLYDTGWPTRLTDAVALSAAAVRSPVAGRVDVTDYLTLRHHIHLKEL